MRLLQLPNWLTPARLSGDWESGRVVAPPKPSRTRSAGSDDAAAPAGDLGAAQPHAVPHSAWTASRVAMQAELWGDGHLVPGGAAETMRDALPLGLTSAATVLMLGSGAGGPPMALANGLGAHVSAFESDPVLLAMSRALAGRDLNAPARRITLAAWNPEAPDLPRNGFHHAVMHDQIRGAVPQVVLGAVTDALKPRGQLVLVETVAGPELDAADPDLLAWRQLDLRPAMVPSPDTIERSLTRLGFEIRVQEDITVRHVKLAIMGWKAMLRRLSAHRPDHGRAAAAALEAELWMRRIRLLSDGKLRLVRWHAVKTR